jgi:hypothetical protein
VYCLGSDLLTFRTICRGRKAMGTTTRLSFKSNGTLALALVAGLSAPLLVGEVYLRHWLPPDVQEYWGGRPGHSDIYKPDPVLGVDYRSYADFSAANAVRLRELGALSSSRPTWLFFGNSFVQAQGMLGDTAQAALPERRMFYLQRNEILPLRIAQARLLLEAGLRPERIFFVLLPHDLWHIGKRPLDFIAVNRQGTITTRIRPPSRPWDLLVRHSRLAMVAWIRTGRAEGDPAFGRGAVAAAPSARIEADMLRLFGVLATLSQRFAVPVTLVVLPNREQVFGRSPFGFQTAMHELARRSGLDYYDARNPFLAADDKKSLFLPDWHLSARGNRLLLQDLLVHVESVNASAPRQARAP